MYTVYTYKCMVLANPTYNFAVYWEQPRDAACDQQALNQRRPLLPRLVLLIRVGQNRIFAPFVW